MSTVLDPPASLERLTLEITRTCQAACTHCYNHSGPQAGHGTMTHEDWLSALEQGAAAGAKEVQFIGGEPSLHPQLPELINAALGHGMAVEVYSNLIHVRRSLWPVFQQPGVSLATSYYSDQAEEHEKITRHRGSYFKTRNNIAKALALGIPLRVGLIHVLPGQRLAEATDELRSLGVQGRIRVDQQRALGRAAEGSDGADPAAELCGNCTRGQATILPTGEVTGCPMSATVGTAGNVQSASLDEVLSGQGWQQLTALLPARQPTACNPDSCTPFNSDCAPWCQPRPLCNPDTSRLS